MDWRFLMQLMQNRRDFLTSASMAAAASVLGTRTTLAEDGPPETTTIRLPHDPSVCVVPAYVADDLLRAEGFTEIRYVPTLAGISVGGMAARGEIDFGIIFAPSIVYHLDTGELITVLAGVHTGCYELFAKERIRRVTDLKGKSVGTPALRSGPHVFLAAIAAYVGLDPSNDINWVPSLSPPAMELFSQGKIDAFLGFPPAAQQTRALGIGHVILNGAVDRPWSEYFCCLLAGNPEFVREHPIATKRVVRAILKATDICAAEPRRAAQRLVDAGIGPGYDIALQTLAEVPYGTWREYDPEDTMRFFALRLHEAGMITSSPNALLAEGTDWRFLNELKRELKA
jgi:NitT/TauT family transport system substrate-binding protein